MLLSLRITIFFPTITHVFFSFLKIVNAGERGITRKYVLGRSLVTFQKHIFASVRPEESKEIRQLRPKENAGR